MDLCNLNDALKQKWHFLWVKKLIEKFLANTMQQTS